MFTGYFPWGFLFGSLIIGGTLTALIIWIRARSISIKWYEWLIGIIGLLLLLFTIQNIFAAIYEWEPQAAVTFAWSFGVLSLIMLGVSVQLVRRRHLSS